MAEFEFAGTTFRGGKMFVVLTALSTLGGGLWGGFEFYKDYMDMKEIVENVDVDAIAAENALVVQKIDESMVRIEEAIEYTRDIKNDLKDDIAKIDAGLDKTSGNVDDKVTRLEGIIVDFEIRNNDTLDKFEEKSKEQIKNTEVLLQKVRDDLAAMRIAMSNSINAFEIKTEGSIDKFENKTKIQLDDAENDLKKAQEELEQQAKEIDEELEKIRDTMGEIRSETSDTLREVEATMRESEKDTRDRMKDTTKNLEDKMDKLEKDLKEMVEEALDNPLNDMQ